MIFHFQKHTQIDKLNKNKYQHSNFLSSIIPHFTIPHVRTGPAYMTKPFPVISRFATFQWRITVYMWRVYHTPVANQQFIAHFCFIAVVTFAVKNYLLVRFVSNVVDIILQWISLLLNFVFDAFVSVVFCVFSAIGAIRSFANPIL